MPRDVLNDNVVASTPNNILSPIWSFMKVLVKCFKGGIRLLSLIVVVMPRREINYILKRPIDALLFLTYCCTSRCKSCTMWRRSDGTDELSPAQWQSAADMCYEMGVRYFELFGGDALLRQDVLIPLIRHIKSRQGTTCDLVTNCNLMTAGMLDEFVDARLDNIWISMDGIGDVHNDIRGSNDGWAKADWTIKYCIQARGSRTYPQVHINTTVSSMNYDKIPNIFNYAAGSGADHIHFEYAGEFSDDCLNHSIIDGISPTPYYVKQDGQSILADEMQAAMIKDMLSLIKRESRQMRIKVHTGNIDRLTISQMRGGRFGNRRCYIMRNKVSIDPRGNILGCPFYGQWILGNICDASRNTIWNNDLHKRFVRHFARRHMKLCPFCILGVQRNESPLAFFRNYIYQELRTARR